MGFIRMTRIDCDGPICQPHSDLITELGGVSFGSLGGGYVTLPDSKPIAQQRKLIAQQFKWSYDPILKKDYCPACTAALAIPERVAAGAPAR